MIADRPLPHSLEAERTLLGVVLYGTPLEMLGFVEAADFFDSRHATIWKRMQGMKNGGIDLVTLRSALEDSGDLEKAGGLAYVASLVDGIPDLAGAPRYATIVKEKSAARTLFRNAERIQTDILRTGGLNAELVAEARNALDDGSAPISFAKSAGLLMRDFATRFEGRFGCGELPGIGTGLPLLDATTGGFQRRVLSLVAARTGVGKTAFGLQVGWAAIKAESARRVAIYSLEMSDAMLSDRLVGSVSGVGLFLVKNPQMSTARQRDAIAAAVSEIGSLGNRLVVNDRVADLRTIEAEVRREARNGLDLVIVDYIQLVRGGKGERRYAEVGDISSRLVTLAKESGAAVVGLAQLGRDAGSRKPCLTDLRESGNLEQDARLVLLLDRPRRRGESAPECQAWVNIAKHSEGESGAEIALHFAGELQRFEEDAEADVTACPFCRGGQR